MPLISGSLICSILSLFQMWIILFHCAMSPPRLNLLWQRARDQWHCCCMGRRHLMLLLSLVMYSSIQLGFTSGLWCSARGEHSCSVAAPLSAAFDCFYPRRFPLSTHYHGFVARIINSFEVLSNFVFVLNSREVFVRFAPHRMKRNHCPFRMGTTDASLPWADGRGNKRLIGFFLVVEVKEQEVNGGKVRFAAFIRF